MRTYSSLAVVVLVAACTYLSPFAASAGELHYGTIVEQYGSKLTLEYKGPAGTRYYVCDTEREACTDKGTKRPNLAPKILGNRSYVRSADGSLGVYATTLGSRTYYTLYRLSGTHVKKLALIPYTTPGATVSVSKNNNAVIFKLGQTYTRYDIAKKSLHTLSLPYSLAFISLSPSAHFLTGYYYPTLQHEIWNFTDGTVIDLAPSMQSYVEFSEDESQLAYLDDVGGFKTLKTMHMKDIQSPKPTVVALTKPNTETEDYLFVGSTLYFLANSAGPLAWDLYRFDGGTPEKVAEQVSYGDFLKRIHTPDATYLAYLTTQGKNTDIALTTPRGATITFDPAPASPLPDTLTRTVRSVAGRTGVLLSPKDTGKRTGTLFIWLHGGPQRQVAQGYHPYLSYAVYDELLERLAAGGNDVFKLDYTGSTGYGAAFRKALDMHIGDVEITDTRNAVTALSRELGSKTVYLIGNSYGGYMALRGIVDMPKLVSGAVSINGVSDWYGLIEQIPSSPFRELFNGVPDTTNLDAYFKASVFTGLDKLPNTRRVLVVWGEQDHTVPVWQSTKYVAYAKTQGVHVQTLSFPTEEHIIRERKNLDALCSAITSTFNLKGVACKG